MSDKPSLEAMEAAIAVWEKIGDGTKSGDDDIKTIARALDAFRAEGVVRERERCIALSDYRIWSTKKCCNTCLTAAQGAMGDGKEAAKFADMIEWTKGMKYDEDKQP